METSSLLSLPYIMPSQAQKHVTHNEAIRSLDAIVQLSVKTADLAAAPQNPQNGDRYIVADNSVGDWQNEVGKIAAFQDGAWAYYTPREGWASWVEDRSQIMVYTAASWQVLDSSQFDMLGINTNADTLNRLAVKSDSILFTSDDSSQGSGDCRMTLNKSNASATASMLFKNQYSARAEIGLTGSDTFAFKVSPDGNSFESAMRIDPANGHVSFGAVDDFHRRMTLSGSSPFLRISNTAGTEAGFEIVDTQASQSQNFQLTYNAGSNNASMRVNGNTVIEMAPDLTTFNTFIDGKNGVCGDYIYSRSRTFIANNYTGQVGAEFANPALATNLDHIWNDDTANEWHFCSDTSYKSTGNAVVRAAAFTATSDYRLKENVTSIDCEGALEQLCSLRPVTFKWSAASGLDTRILVKGFIAHEVQNIVPSAIRGEKDAMSADGSRPIFQSIDHDQILPVVVAALQSVISRADSFERELAELKHKIANE